jgi:hypothetical protein
VDLSDTLPEEIEEEVKAAAEISMGTEVHTLLPYLNEALVSAICNYVITISPKLHTKIMLTVLDTVGILQVLLLICFLEKAA